VLTPTHGSWLNIVETLFGKMTRTFLRQIRVGSKKELKERILLGIAEINEMPVVHRWKTFDALEAACHAVWGGARLYSASQALYFATATGRAIGTSRAITAMIRSVTGCTVHVIGKPSLDALRAARRRLGVPMADLAVVGDDLYVGGQFGSVDPTTGVAVINGTITCNRPAFVQFSGQLKRNLGTGVVSGFFFTFVPCNGTSAWSATVGSVPSLLHGRSASIFVPGKADVTASAFAFDPDTSDFVHSNIITSVVLQGSH